MAAEKLGLVRELASISEQLAETYNLLELQQEQADSLQNQMSALAKELQEVKEKYRGNAAHAGELQARSHVSLFSSLASEMARD